VIHRVLQHSQFRHHELSCPQVSLYYCWFTRAVNQYAKRNESHLATNAIPSSAHAEFA